MTKLEVLRLSLKAVEKVQGEGSIFDEQKSKETFNKISQELEAEKRKAEQMKYRDADYQFNL